MRNNIALLFIPAFLSACGGGGVVGGASVPVVTITSPATDNWARKTITVTGTVTSPNTLAKVELLVDSVSVANATNLTAPSFPLDTTAAAYRDGPHSVAMRATDSLGLVTTSNAVVIKVDNTPPTTSGGWAGTSTISATGIASDNYSGVVSATNSFDGSVVSVGADGAWSFANIGVYDPFAVQTTRITDAAGNCSDYKIPSVVNTVIRQSCGYICLPNITIYVNPGVFTLDVAGACP
jgi:hypothetical protein